LKEKQDIQKKYNLPPKKENYCIGCDDPAQPGDIDKNQQN
jgi:hypothetical protein